MTHEPNGEQTKVTKLSPRQRWPKATQVTQQWKIKI